MTRHDQPVTQNGTSVVVPTTTKSYRPSGNGKDVSPTPEGDRLRDYQENGLLSFWVPGTRGVQA